MARKWFLAALVLCPLSLTAGAAQAAPCALPAPEAVMTLDELVEASALCLRERQDAKAGRIFYAYSIRLRALASLDQNSSGYGLTAKKIQAQIGAPVNRWLGGDLGEWASALSWAREWERSSRWPEGDALFAKLGASSVEKAGALNNARRAVDKLSGDLSRIDRAAFYSKRKESRLEVRDSEFYQRR